MTSDVPKNTVVLPHVTPIRMHLASFLLRPGRQEGGLSQGACPTLPEARLSLTPHWPPHPSWFSGTGTRWCPSREAMSPECPAEFRPVRLWGSFCHFLKLPTLLSFTKPPCPVLPKMWYTPLEQYDRAF